MTNIFKKNCIWSSARGLTFSTFYYKFNEYHQNTKKKVLICTRSVKRPAIVKIVQKQNKKYKKKYQNN